MSSGRASRVYKPCSAEYATLWAIKLFVRGAGGKVIEHVINKNSRKLAIAIEYESTGTAHLLGFFFSERFWYTSFATIAKYLSVLEEWASKVSSKAGLSYDTYTYVAVFPRITKPVWSIARGVAYLSTTYEKIDHIRRTVQNMYIARCRNHYNGLKPFFCSIAEKLEPQ